MFSPFEGCVEQIVQSGQMMGFHNASAFNFVAAFLPKSMIIIHAQSL